MYDVNQNIFFLRYCNCKCLCIWCGWIIIFFGAFFWKIRINFSLVDIIPFYNADGCEYNIEETIVFGFGNTT